jgi:CheY-like chemotaxis protein/HPt (histidine-containing phosphotransfer) domain-containing protein
MIDKFKQAFQEQAREILVELEAALLELGDRPADTELVGRAFRALHTIKGSGSMFGFDELAAFTHNLENAFDEVRNGRLGVTPDLINISLSALDQIKAMIEEGGSGVSTNAAAPAEILTKLRQLTGSSLRTEPSEEPKKPAPSAAARGAAHDWIIRFFPGPDLLRNGANPLMLLDELKQLGNLRITANVAAIPPLAELDPTRCYLGWELVLTTPAAREGIRDVFIFVEDSCELAIEPAADQALAATASATPKVAEEKRSSSGRRASDVPDKGSTFWFTAILEKQPRASRPAVELPTCLLNAKVLIADDSAANQGLLRGFLTTWGCRAEEAANGKSALAALRQAIQTPDPFQVSILDTRLPGIDGQELVKQIAAEPQLKDMAILLMTDFGQKSDLAGLQGIGNIAQVSKPVWESTLRKALVLLCAKRSGSVAADTKVFQAPSSDIATHQERILLAEDNPVNQEVAMAMLARLGYRADRVSNGIEALQALARADYDLVLMDCLMPEMDGYEATRSIRQGKSGARDPRVPIIAVTADAMAGDRDRCLQAGMSDYISKPIELRKLSDALEKFLAAPSNVKEPAPAGSQSQKRSEPVFNRDEMFSRLMGDKKLAGKVISAFLTDAPRQLLVLKSKLKTGDAQSVQIVAHSLKGAAATLSAKSMRTLCLEMQEAAAAKDLNRASALLPLLEEQFELLKAALKQAGWS